jgi:hypothetical protein
MEGNDAQGQAQLQVSYLPEQERGYVYGKWM